MQEKGTSVFENGLIWFGAAVSLAEIVTGTYFAPLGFSKGLLAIIIGHVIGCVMLFFAGLIGGMTRKSAMETTKMSFGKNGCMLFAALNVMQLVGWTAIMIYDGAVSANALWSIGNTVWCLVIGGLIILWIAVGIKNLGKINTVAMSALFILTIILCFSIFKKENILTPAGEGLTFGAAVELSVAMPLSWLPLISDYTKDSSRPVRATLASSVVYGVVSCWMYVIGMGAAILTQKTDIAQVMLGAGIGVAGLIIVILSTVTTTFLDAYSAGISCETISGKLKGKWFAIITTIIGILGAILFPLENITDFLYLIGSVFAPMIAILMTDFFILKKDTSEKSLNVVNLIIWVFGFILYRVLMRFDLPVGNTLPLMVVIVLVTILIRKIAKWCHH